MVYKVLSFQVNHLNCWTFKIFIVSYFIFTFYLATVAYLIPHLCCLNVFVPIFFFSCDSRWGFCCIFSIFLFKKNVDELSVPVFFDVDHHQSEQFFCLPLLDGCHLRMWQIFYLFISMEKSRMEHFFFILSVIFEFLPIPDAAFRESYLWILRRILVSLLKDVSFLN